MKLRVADFNIDVKHISEKFFAERYKEYVSDFDKADLIIKFDKVEKLYQQGDYIETLADNTVVSVIGNDICETYYAYNVPYMTIIRSNDFSNINIEILKRFPKEKFQLIEQVHTGLLFSRFLASRGGVSFHSSCISYDGEAICFTAPSGMGKSTHANNWAKEFGDHVERINDDKPAIIFIDDIPYVCGTPWSGKECINKNLIVPLKAIAYINRGEKNDAKQMGREESLLRLIEQTIAMRWDTETTDALIPQLEKLLDAVPFYNIICNTEQESAKVAYKKIFGGEYEN